MHEKGICRFSEGYSKTSGVSRSEGRRPFAMTGSTSHYAPDRPFKLEHICLNVEVDPKGKTLEGRVTYTVRTVMPDQHRLKLDQIGIQIDEVLIKNKKTDFSMDGNQLNIDLGSVPETGEVFELSVKYRVKDPRRGLYFTGPDADYPNKPVQVWSQGQDEDNRYWIPILDYPNQKATSEMIATVPRGFVALSNGALVSKQDVARGIQYHYKLNTPHVTYLITLVVGEFSEWADVGPRSLPVQYFVAPGREEDGKRAFGNTVGMIEAFEKKTGVPYPYEKYSQVAVQDFIFGGMENTSASTQTDMTLHDARAHLDFSSDPLISHELAHQWFGDLLTCRDWSHGWLNEGFATFMERVWVECNPGPGGGWEEAKYYSYQDLKAYLDEDGGHYRRPIVCNVYIEPIDLFDRHLYQKGGLVVNLLRHVLGEDLFWKSIQLYLNKHRGQNVETLDLIRAIEDATGRNLRRLFDEWVFNSGHPEFEVTYSWDEEKKLTEWVIEQKQTGGQPSVTRDGATTLLFHLPVVLELTLEDGKKIRHRVEIGEARERVFLPAPSKPFMVRFDPDAGIPKTLKFPRPKEMLIYQLKHDSDCMGRIEAAQELSKVADLEAVSRLGDAAAQDPFWGVQAEAAKALSSIRMDASRDVLIEALKTRNPKGRRAIANALGSFRDEKAAEALRKLAEKDESYFVEADSTSAWSAARILPLEISANAGVEEIEQFLLKQLKKPSYREVIRAAALNGLADIPGLAQGDRPATLQTIADWTRRGKEIDVRVAAVRALGKIFKKAAVPVREKILEIFSHLGDEDHFRLRIQLAYTLEQSGHPQTIPLLSRIGQMDTDGRVKRASKGAIDSLLTAGFVPESVANLKTALEKLEEDYRKLRSLVEERQSSVSK